MKTFIYSLSDPSNNFPVYIGKSDVPEERFRLHLSDLRGNTNKVDWIKSLKLNGLKPKIEIIDEVPISEWQFWEMHYISLYKSWGFSLLNQTIGGVSGSGKHKQSAKEKISEARKKHNPGGFKKGHKINLGRPLTPEIKEKISLNLKSKNRSSWNAGTVGKTKHSEDTRKIMSEKKKEYWKNKK